MTREIRTHLVDEDDLGPTVHAVGEPGQGGAHVAYVFPTDHDDIHLPFQSGPGPANGLTNEALLAIVADRLEGFNSGPFACGDNETALGHVREALKWLHSRTKERRVRGVEGKLEA